MKKTTALLSGMLVWTAAISNASQIILDPGSLPSNQGWEYSPNGIHEDVIETDIFSTDGSILTMNSIGQALSESAGGTILYRNYDVVSTAQPTVLEWTSQSVDYENASHLHQYFGFYMGFTVDSLRYGVGINPDEITLYHGSGYKYITVDTTQYHTFRIATVTGSSSYDFYIDDILQDTASAQPLSQVNQVAFGDGTGTANANVDITALEFTQIPEPGTTGLIGIVAGGIIFVRRLFPAA